MTSIAVALSGFRRSRPRSLIVTASESALIRTAMFVGVPTLASGVPAARPLLELQWRAAMVRASLRLTADGSGWTRSASYDRLDRSEKVAVSYFLGMLQAGLTTAALGYPQLVHVDRLLAASGRPVQGRRPDFVAVQIPTSGGGIYGATVEAKGRTNKFDPAALATAKVQAATIPTISGLTATETIASESYFDAADVWCSTLEARQHVVGRTRLVVLASRTTPFIMYRYTCVERHGDPT